MSVNNIYRKSGGPGDPIKKKKKDNQEVPPDFTFPTLDSIIPINYNLQQLEIPQMDSYTSLPDSLPYVRKEYQQFYNGGNLEKEDRSKVVGGVGKGAISGAATGATVAGPWGALVGGVIGGVTGGITTNNKVKAENDMLANNIDNNNLVNDQYALDKQQQLENYNGIYAMGGELPSSNQENETLNEFNGGGTHEENPQGGIPVGNGNSVEAGETEFTPENYVFSDRILINKEIQKEYGIPKTTIGKSFADYSKKINKKYSYRKADSIDNDSKNRELKLLMGAQESFKKVEMPHPNNQHPAQQPPQQLPSSPQMNQMGQMPIQQSSPQQMANGGYRMLDTNQQGNGTPVNVPVNTGYGWLSNPTIPTYNDVYGKQNNTVINKNTNSSDIIEANVNVPKTTEINKDVPLLTNGEKIGAFAPMAYNLIQGLNKSNQTDNKKYNVTPGKATAYTIDINGALRKNNNTYNAQRNAIESGAGGNGASYLANISQAQAIKQNADSDLIIKKENIDKGIKSKVQQYNIGNQLTSDRANSQQQYRVDQDNLQASAQKDAHLGATTLQAQQIANLYAQNRFNKATSDELIKAGYARNAQEAFLIMRNPELMKKIQSNGK